MSNCKCASSSIGMSSTEYGITKECLTRYDPSRCYFKTMCSNCNVIFYEHLYYGDGKQYYSYRNRYEDRYVTHY